MLSLVISKILLNAFTTNVIYKGPTIFKMFQYSWKKNLYNLFFKRAYKYEFMLNEIATVKCFDIIIHLKYENPPNFFSIRATLPMLTWHRPCEKVSKS